MRNASDYDDSFASIAASIPSGGGGSNSSGSGSAGDLPFSPADDSSWRGTWRDYNDTYARNSDGSWSDNPPLKKNNTSSIANSFLGGSNSGGLAMGLLPSASEMLSSTMPKIANPSLTPAQSATNPLTGTNNNNYFDGTGFAYTDKYGFPHVSDTYKHAAQYSGNGNVYEYNGPYGGGYALNEKGSRLALPLPGARAYGNESENVTYKDGVAVNPETLLMPTSNFQSQYPDYLSWGTDDASLDSRLLALGADKQTVASMSSYQKRQALNEYYGGGY